MTCRTPPNCALRDVKEEACPLVWEHWTEPLRARCGSGLSDYRGMSAAVLAMFVALHPLFR